MGPASSSAGWSRRRKSPRTSRSGRRATGRTASSRARTSAGTGSAVFTYAPTASCSRPPAPCTTDAHCSTAPRSRTAMCARSERSAAPRPMRARFRATYTSAQPPKYDRFLLGGAWFRDLPQRRRNSHMENALSAATRRFKAWLRTIPSTDSVGKAFRYAARYRVKAMCTKPASGNGRPVTPANLRSAGEGRRGVAL
jgi:hypothetical protein